MNKDYAEYRLKHFVRHFDLSFERGDEKEPLTNHYEEIEGKFRRVEGVYKFGLMIILKNAPGCGFSRTSEPFNLESTTKSGLDQIFLETYQRLISDVCSNIVLNIREGK